MLKIVLEVKEEKDSCKVKLKHVSNVEKAKESEKRTGAVIYGEIEKMLKNLQK